ncbi:MAG: hypothetical protein ACOVJ6_01005, partial [Pirellulales bacterium]
MNYGHLATPVNESGFQSKHDPDGILSSAFRYWSWFPPSCRVGARHAAFNARREGFKPATWRANFTLNAGALADWLATLPPGMT